ncbi:MAG: DNA-directed RNA polymerase subunit beta', partial [Planctomycetales bacterium 12-60-4]
KKIALELFQPFIIRRLKELGHADTIKSAKRMLERRDEEVWDILEEVITNHPVLLNRAPTLHRMGIQAFEPTLVEGNAIRIHPLVCKGFNADFDGDQMAVHLPLSIEAQVEATTLMMSTNNVFSPANGAPIISPSQDIVMGCYYATLRKEGRPGHGMQLANLQEVHTALLHRKVTLHTTVRVRLPKDKRVKGEFAETFKLGGLIETSVGRVMFNDILPAKMSFYNITMKSKDLANVISDCYLELGRRATINLLDKMKEFGFLQSTRSGLSFATSDLRTPANKDAVITESEKIVLQTQKLYEKGLITARERYEKVLDTWTHASEQIRGAMMDSFKHDVRDNGAYCNPIFLMADSGARGGQEQIRQLAGMRGLMAKPSGEIIETPIKANFREGLSVLEYFSSTHGARKGLADTALKTADSGYLTRKLADICQNLVITTHDCGTTKGMTRGIVYRGEKVEVGLAEAIRGRVSRTNIVNPITDESIVRENEMITVDIARRIEEMGLEKIQVRSPMTCEAELGLCRLCYGMDLSTGALVEEGLATGIIAAQSIGEPGTQLTMRTFHIGGVAIKDVQENELKTRRAGRVRFVRIRSVVNAEGRSVVLGRNGEVTIIDNKERELEKYPIPAGAVLAVDENAMIDAGQTICNWDPHAVPILCEVGGRVRFEDLLEGQSMRTEKDSSGNARRTVIEHKGDLHPQVI